MSTHRRRGAETAENRESGAQTELARSLQYLDRESTHSTAKEIAMFTTTQNRNAVERTVCTLLAALIVSVGLATGALGMHVAERNAVSAVVKHVA